MAYLKIIEASTTWTCPKSGDYKVICVAAGASATYLTSGRYQFNSGGATSFGSLLTAAGTIANKGDAYSGYFTCPSKNPLDGYTIHNSNYGKISIIAECITHSGTSTSGSANNGYGCGYGAGGAGNAASSLNNATYGGLCGKMKMEIFHLEEGETYAVTVGTGNTGKINSKTSSSDTVYYSLPAAGSDGVVIIQEV